MPENALHNEMLNGDSRDVSSGIEYLSGGRYVNPSRVAVDIDSEKIAARAAEYPEITTRTGPTT